MTWHNMNETEFDSYNDKLYNDKKNLRQLFFETDRGLVLGSLVGEYEEHYMSKMSFEDFLKVIEPDIIEPVDYIGYLIENNLGRDAHANDFEFMKEVDYERLDVYVDYKRGYETMLYIYELDYKAFGIKPPKKTERDYLGVRYTQYQDGDITDFEISKYKQVTKKITVKKWKAL